ncbi:hypothetical protein GCM10009850_060390 [Nonomuraea monospora]|uniref:DUF4365 domain-containing protein n=1 Tax=Nonomuraea monospora TaxID=568818 RepID=A0ABN3CMP5_9ACTN
MAVTLEHEYLIELVRNRPSLVPFLLTEMGIAVPAFDQTSLGNTDFTDCRPTEYRADSVVVMARSGETVNAVVLEIQRAPDEQKHWSWPVYLSTLRARTKCPVLLVVFCQDAATARNCAKAIDMGHPGWVLVPIVVGPEEVPQIIDTTQAAANSELITLSVIVHSTHASELRDKIVQTYVQAIAESPEDRPSYIELVLSSVPRSVAKKIYEELKMTVDHDYLKTFDFVREWVEVGKAEGEAEAILLIFERRDVSVPQEARERILACTDVATLRTWISRAITATTADELFD